MKKKPNEEGLRRIFDPLATLAGLALSAFALDVIHIICHL
jgi:hypothetical protein